MPFKLPDNDEYLGNMWGWKVSYWSLAFIVLVFTVMVARSCYLEKNPQDRVLEPEKIEIIK